MFHLYLLYGTHVVLCPAEISPPLPPKKSIFTINFSEPLRRIEVTTVKCSFVFVASLKETVHLRKICIF